MTQEKACKKCGLSKPVRDFYEVKTAEGRPQRYTTNCKRCCIAYVTKYNKEHHEDVVLKSRRKRSKQIVQKCSAWKRNNRQKALEQERRHRAKNPGLYTAYGRARQQKERNAKPTWSIDFFVEEAYRLAAARTQLTGLVWHVDHVVPLQSKKVCGLHAHTNIAVIPAAENMRKGNRRWPDMPECRQ